MLCLSELIDLNLFASKQCNVQEHSHLLDDLINTIEDDFWAELAQIQAESISWIPLDEGAYLGIPPIL
jgi:hypothetical protein